VREEFVAAEKGIAAISSLLIGSGLLAYGLYQRARLRASQSWPTVPGTIANAVLAKETSTDENGTSTSYHADVRYQYAVNGVAYTGKRIGFIRHSYIRHSRAQAELDRYPVNSTVQVFFDPEKPSDAILVREAPSSFLYIGGGAVILALGLVLVFESLG
jgi:hypothetical protein